MTPQATETEWLEVGGGGGVEFRPKTAVVLSVSDERSAGVGCLRIHSGPKCIVVVAILLRGGFE